MAIADDFSISSTGNIRYTGTGTNYTVIAFHRWLGDLMDDAQAAGNDILDITDATASERSTDNIITLNSPYNIDDIAAQHLYDGSIIQDAGNTIYDGILVFASAGAYLQIIQNGTPASPNFWTTGLNADANNGISHRFMLKVRSGGVDIDLRRIIGQTRVFGSTYSEFRINGTSRGNNVLALTYASDLNNQTAEPTIEGRTSITNVQGYQLLDVDNDTIAEPYFSQWNRDGYSINTLYERAKWLSRTSTVEDGYLGTGANDNLIGDGTTTRQSQAFANGVVPQYLTRVKTKLKKVGSPTGTLTAKLYALTGSYGTTATPTGSALATSVNFNVAELTTSFLEKEIAFADGYQYLMGASTRYGISFEYSGGDVSNYVQIDGSSPGSHEGNQASFAGSWTAHATRDLYFECFASPDLYGVPGEIFRGITHEIVVDGYSGTHSAVERVTWSGGSGLQLAIDSLTTPSKMWIQLITGVAPTNDQVITGVTSGATATVNVTITERTLSYPFIGASTGSALIGAYGIGVETADLTANDKLFDLGNVQRTPPNNVTFTVSGLIIGEDRVLVGPESGGLLNTAQFALDASLTGAVTSIVMTTSIPLDTPSLGTIRVELNSGIYRRVEYTSYSGSTFFMNSTDFTSDNATAGNDVYISYIDKLATATSESFTVVFQSTRALFVRVRDGGGTPIKTFETTASLGSGGGSATAIRTSDA